MAVSFVHRLDIVKSFRAITGMCISYKDLHVYNSVEVPWERNVLWFCFLISPHLNEWSQLYESSSCLTRRFLRMKEEWRHFRMLKGRLKILEAAEQKVFQYRNAFRFYAEISISNSSCFVSDVKQDR